jgi:hypothetical protein
VHTPRPPVPANGLAPRRVVGGANRFGRIGSDGKLPGIEQAAIFQVFNCGDTWGSICSVTFAANFAAQGNETAFIYLDNGQRATVGAIPPGRGRYVMALPGCSQQSHVAFYVKSNAGDPPGIQSTLDLDDVTSECWGLTPPAGPTPITPTEPEEPRQFSPTPLPDRQAALETTPPLLASLAIGPGATAIAYPLWRNGNALDEVLPAAEGTVLMKWDPHSGPSTQTYQRAGTHWLPEGGTLAPGEGAFILSFAPVQVFPLLGDPASLPPRPHPDAIEEFLGNPIAAPAGFEQITGCAPRAGDQVVRYRRSTPAFPPEPAQVHSFDGSTWIPVLSIDVGEAVLVRFAPAVVPQPPPPILIQTEDSGVRLSAAGPLPPEPVLQSASDIAGPWKTLVGVTLPDSFGATHDHSFFRLATQLPLGGIAGTAVDASGQPVPGVTVQLAPLGPVATTAPDGQFHFNSVPAGQVDLVAYRSVWNAGSDGLTERLLLPTTLTITVPAGATAALLLEANGQDQCHGVTQTEWGDWHKDADGLEWREGEVWFRCVDNPKHGTDKKLGTVREEKRRDARTGTTTNRTVDKDPNGNVTKVTETVTDRAGKVTKTTTEYTYDAKGGLTGAKQTVEKNGQSTTTEWKKEANGKWYKKDGARWVEDAKGPPLPPK